MQTYRFLLLASVAVLAACGSRGPGEIGSHDDIIIRNAGDAPLTKAADKMGPMIPEGEMAERAEGAEEESAEPLEETPVPAPEVAESDLNEPVSDEVSADSLNNEPAEGHEFEAQKEDVVEMAPEEISVEEPVASEPMAEPAVEGPAPMATTTMSAPPSPEMDGTVMGAPEEPAIEAVAEQPTAQENPIQNHSAPVLQSAPVASEPMAEPVQKVMEPIQTETEKSVERVIEQKPAPVSKSPVSKSPVSEPVVPAQGLPKAPYLPYEAKPLPVEGAVEAVPALDDIAVLPTLNVDMISSVQTALKTKGYYFGAVDGTLGAETLNALTLYQNAHGIEGGGTLNNATLKKLGLPAVGQ